MRTEGTTLVAELARRWPGRAGFVLLSAIWLSPAGCEDPALQAEIAALGPEAPGVPVGELHRPDQPCVLCHQVGGNASPFLVGGTVHYAGDRPQPVASVEVVLVDSLGKTHRTTSNCAGNFFVRTTDWQPRAPIWASLLAGAHEIHMESPIYREGSCAVCHFRPAGPRSAGQVYLTDDPMERIALPPSTCAPRGGP